MSILDDDTVSEAQEKAKGFKRWEDCPHITGTLPTKEEGGRRFRKNQPGDRCSYAPETARWLRDEHDNFRFAFASPQEQMEAHYIGKAFKRRNRQPDNQSRIGEMESEIAELKGMVKGLTAALQEAKS